MQQKRSDLLATLRDEAKQKLMSRLQKPEARKEALKRLIVQVSKVSIRDWPDYWRRMS